MSALSGTIFPSCGEAELNVTVPVLNSEAAGISWVFLVSSYGAMA